MKNNIATHSKKTSNTITGLVTASYGKRYGVELADGKKISCVTRGKKTDLACGDIVSIQMTDSREGVVESFEPRTTLLYRSNAYRTKYLAANVSQIIIVLATEPSFYVELLNRCLIGAEAAGIKALILLNKCDLSDNTAPLKLLEYYTQLGYPILPMAATEDVKPLMPYLENETSILVGQSGMGKSTIINALLPEAKSRTREVSVTLDSGKHTTTAAHYYHLNANSHLIDSPGLQEFGLYHLTPEEVEMSFKEFRPYLGHCRFNNCKHQNEPDCAIHNAVNAGVIAPARLACFQGVLQELAFKP